MDYLTKEFDESLERTGKIVQDALEAGEELILKSLLSEIEVFEYTTISQVKGAIHGHLDRLNKTRGR